MKKPLIGFMVLLFLVQACVSSTPTTAPTPVSTFAPMGTAVSVTEAPVTEPASGLKGLGGVPCPDSAFTCVTLTVPLNHFDANDSRTVKVVFAILPATGERKGMFVTATGGPGSAGLTSADSYTSSFDPSITEHFDIVFFDQRGVGQSGGLQCTKAAATFYRGDWSANTPQEEAAMVKSARTFSNDCVEPTNQWKIWRLSGRPWAMKNSGCMAKVMEPNIPRLMPPRIPIIWLASFWTAPWI
jgi:hypothetical protein